MKKEHIEELLAWAKEKDALSISELYNEARRRYAQYYTRFTIGKLLKEVFKRINENNK